MIIYILRHGEAEPRGKRTADADRHLTKKGARGVERVITTARKAGMRVEIVLTSPYLRASESAVIAAAPIEPKPRIVKTEALLPDTRPQAVWREVRSYSKFKHLLLVGHEPQLSALLAHLLGAPSLQIDFKKGALARIQLKQLDEEPAGRLKWILTPRLAA